MVKLVFIWIHRYEQMTSNLGHSWSSMGETCLAQKMEKASMCQWKRDIMLQDPVFSTEAEEIHRNRTSLCNIVQVSLRNHLKSKSSQLYSARFLLEIIGDSPCHDFNFVAPSQASMLKQRQWHVTVHRAPGSPGFCSLSTWSECPWSPRSWRLGDDGALVMMKWLVLRFSLACLMGKQWM